jgi:hypothetical protein
MTAAKSPGAVAALGAPEIDQLGGKVNSENSHTATFTQGAIRAELIGSDRCSALGVTAIDSTPALELSVACRSRSGTIRQRRLRPIAVKSFAFASVRLGGRLTVEDDWRGQPRLRRWRDRRDRCGAGSPVALIDQGVTHPERRANRCTGPCHDSGAIARAAWPCRTMAPHRSRRRKTRIR